MAKAEWKGKLKVDKNKLFDVITAYESYPDFVTGVKKVQVSRTGESGARVTYHVSMMKDVVYTLEHRHDRGAGKVEWSLVESGDFKKNVGSWTIREAGAGESEVEYALDVEFNFPVPGFILKKLISSQLPSTVQSFEKRALKK